MVFVLAAGTAVAAPSSPLARIEDANELEAELTAICSDPALIVAAPRDREVARGLLAEGVEYLQQKSYEQGLANLLAAYAKVPSPKILLDVASTLEDMGRTADAADTYRRYLADPHTVDNVPEITEVLRRLDGQLTSLTIHVEPPLSEISIDGGAFVKVRDELALRVRPGLHLVRVRNGTAERELTINGFEGEHKAVLANLPGAPNPTSIDDSIPRHLDGWLIGGLYASDPAHPDERRVLDRAGGSQIVAIAPKLEIRTRPDDHPATTPTPARLSTGGIAAVRIDAAGRGFAGALGIALARGAIEGDVMVLRSKQTGGFVGARYRFLDGLLRPYGSLGFPGFVFDDTSRDTTGMQQSNTKLALGIRFAAGLELEISRHFSVHADFGFEHFWFLDDTEFLSNLWVPSIGVTGRL